MAQSQDIGIWLAGLGAAEFAQNFLACGYTTSGAAAAARLSQDDLREMGLAKLRSRKAVYNALLEEANGSRAGGDGGGGSGDGFTSAPGGGQPQQQAGNFMDFAPEQPPMEEPQAFPFGGGGGDSLRAPWEGGWGGAAPFDGGGGGDVDSHRNWNALGSSSGSSLLGHGAAGLGGGGLGGLPGTLGGEQSQSLGILPQSELSLQHPTAPGSGGSGSWMASGASAPAPRFGGDSGGGGGGGARGGGGFVPPGNDQWGAVVPAPAPATEPWNLWSNEAGSGVASGTTLGGTSAVAVGAPMVRSRSEGAPLLGGVGGGVGGIEGGNTNQKSVHHKQLARAGHSTPGTTQHSVTRRQQQQQQQQQQQSSSSSSPTQQLSQQERRRQQQKTPGSQEVSQRGQSLAQQAQEAKEAKLLAQRQAALAKQQQRKEQDAAKYELACAVTPCSLIISSRLNFTFTTPR